MADARKLGLWERWRSYLFFNPLIYFYTFVCGTLSLLSSFFDSKGRIQHGFARLWSRLILGTSGCRLQVEGLENVDLSQPYIYASNHLSAFDIPTLISARFFKSRMADGLGTTGSQFS